MVIVYIIASVALALFCFHNINRYDGPPISYVTVNYAMRSSQSFIEVGDIIYIYYMRRILRGSWFIAIWMFISWLAFLLIISLSSIRLQIHIIEFLFALPGGFALTVAAYNVNKRMRITVSTIRDRISEYATWEHTVDWQNNIISPRRDKLFKFNNLYPCPGIIRLSTMVCFLAVCFGIYYCGTILFGLERLDWATPLWTVKYTVLFVTSILLGIMGGLLGAAFATTIKVSNKILNDFFIIIWQYLANGSILWVVIIGAAMSFLLGLEEAKSTVIHFGVIAFIHVVVIGSIVGLLSGIALFFNRIFRMSFVSYFVFSLVISFLAAKWNFQIYGIQSNLWFVIGTIAPILLLILALPRIDRDFQQRRLMMESLHSEDRR